MELQTILKRVRSEVPEVDLSNRSRRTIFAWFGLVPSLAILTLFKFIPLLWNLHLSFHEMSFTGETSWVGLTNWRMILSDPVFMKSLINTFLFLSSVPLAILIALGIALLLNQTFIGSNLFRSIFFFPYISMTVAIAVIWTYMFKTDGGVVNYLLIQSGIIEGNISWLTDSFWARVSIIVIQTWKTVGFYMIIILAGLQNIPEQVYEVSRIDGANRFQRFYYITLPLIKPTLAVCALVGVTTSFLLFDLIIVLTNGGPSRSTEVLITWLYKQAFEFGEFGYAAVLTMILFVIMTVIGLGLARWLQTEGYS